MVVRIYPVVLLAGLASGLLHAQTRAEDLFIETQHDFGEVARGAKAEYTFVLHNTTQQTIHIKSVRSSCGCTQPRVLNDTAAPGEKAKIVAAFDTARFAGKRGATLTVLIDRPRLEEVRLKIDGVIRTDVTFNPGEIVFGTVRHGSAKQMSIEITYSGNRRNWEIQQVTTASNYLETELERAPQRNGRITYRLTVQLAEDTPLGYFHDFIQLKTNDAQPIETSLEVQASIVAPLSVSPSHLVLGSVPVGKSVQRRLVVSGEAPFRILEMTSDASGLSFQIPSEPKKVHVVPCTFRADSSVRVVDGSIVVRTDLESMPETSIKISGQVVAN